GLTGRTAAAANNFSNPQATGIYYLPPEPKVDAFPGKAGMIIIDDGGQGFGPPARATSPDRGDLWFLGVTEFAVQKKLPVRATPLCNNIGSNPDDCNLATNTGTLGGGFNYTMLLGYTLRFTMRFQLAMNADITFCPDGDVAGGTAGCAAGAPYFDLQREVRVAFGNNNISEPLIGLTRNPATNNPAYWVMDRPLGFLHFFKPLFPDVWEN
ncbi:MAG: hypothetical protein AAF202_05550, partial [Pseudomonadota bacterium]